MICKNTDFEKELRRDETEEGGRQELERDKHYDRVLLQAIWGPCTARHCLCVGQQPLTFTHARLRSLSLLLSHLPIPPLSSLSPSPLSFPSSFTTPKRALHFPPALYSPLISSLVTISSPPLFPFTRPAVQHEPCLKPFA